MLQPLTEIQEARFWAKVKVTTREACWIWVAAGGKYGHFTIGGKHFMAHRVAYYLETGQQPAEVCHRCDTPRCVNPAHLFAGDTSANMLDCYSKGRMPPRAGECNPNAKLAFADAQRIREEYGDPSKHSQGRREAEEGLPSLSVLALKYGVRPGTIREIIKGHTYKVPRKEVMPL